MITEWILCLVQEVPRLGTVRSYFTLSTESGFTQDPDGALRFCSEKEATALKGMLKSEIAEGLEAITFPKVVPGQKNIVYREPQSRSQSKECDAIG